MATPLRLFELNGFDSAKPSNPCQPKKTKIILVANYFNISASGCLHQRRCGKAEFE
jgi:hypothetical protein